MPVSNDMITQAERSDAVGNGVYRPARGHPAGIKTAGSSVKNWGSVAHSLELSSSPRFGTYQSFDLGKLWT